MVSGGRIKTPVINGLLRVDAMQSFWEAPLVGLRSATDCLGVATRQQRRNLETYPGSKLFSVWVWWKLGALAPRVLLLCGCSQQHR